MITLALPLSFFHSFVLGETVDDSSPASTLLITAAHGSDEREAIGLHGVREPRGNRVWSPRGRSKAKGYRVPTAKNTPTRLIMIASRMERHTWEEGIEGMAESEFFFLGGVARMRRGGWVGFQ
jgi:hypothetical protein